MAHDINDNPKDGEQAQPNGGRPFLMVLVREDGSIEVKGWIDNKVTSYGLLEAAKDAVKEHIDKSVKIARVNGSGGLINHIRNWFKK